MPRSSVVLASTLIACLAGATPAAAQQAIVSLAPSASGVPMTGRLFVIFARSADREPRFLAGSYGGRRRGRDAREDRDRVPDRLPPLGQET